MELRPLAILVVAGAAVDQNREAILFDQEALNGDLEQAGTEGIPYAGLDNVWILGGKKDLGLLLKCAPYSLYKRGGISDWAQFIELFGQPVRIIKYDSFDEQTRSELKKILDESGSSLSLMIPRQADFEIKDGKQTNCDGNLQLSFIKAMNEELSITILGNTETGLCGWR